MLYVFLLYWFLCLFLFVCFLRPFVMYHFLFQFPGKNKKKKKNFLFFCARVCFSFLRIFTVTTAGTPTVTVRRPKMLSIIFVCVCNHQVVHLATLKKKGNGWVMKKKQKKKTRRPSNVFTGELLGQLGVLEEFGMRALVLETVASCRRLGTGGSGRGVGASACCRRVLSSG